MKSQTAFFNSVAENWDEMCRHDMIKVDFMLELLQVEEGQQLLDVGTGTGILIPSLVKRIGTTGSIKGIDLAEKMIEVAKQKNNFSNVVFKCEDALDYNIDESSYDAIICYSMFPHFEDKEKAVAVLAKKLKANGKLMICHSQSRVAINTIHRKANEVVREDNLPPVEVIEAYFLKAHLNVIQVIDNEEMFVVLGCKSNRA